MDDELNLAESEDADLHLDDVFGEEALKLSEPEKPDGSDFNLDDFLAEDTGANAETTDLSLPQGDINLDNLLEDETPVHAEAAKEKKNRFEAETEVPPVTDAEATVNIEAGIAEPEPETSVAESGWLAEPVLEDELTEEASISGEGLTNEDFSVAGDDASREENLSEADSLADGHVSDEGGLSFRAEEEKDETEEQEAVSAAEDENEPVKGWAFDGLSDDKVEAPANEDTYSNDGNLTAEVSGASDDYSAEDFESVGVSAENQILSETGYDIRGEAGYVRWYSGSSEEPAYEVDKHSVSAVLSGDETCKTIHVNVGYDTYGWVVEFADGTVMNLRDVREYQLRNGVLPAADGAIVYGAARTEFHNIEKIKIYESVRYFTYSSD